ncbi:MAG: hypothetical protein ACP5N2_02630 [Candidatus Nanoarchaeia archaeon]
MSLKEFLKPEWKKFVLPVLLVLMFIFVLFPFYSIGSFNNDVACEVYPKILDLSKNLQEINSGFVEWESGTYSEEELRIKTKQEEQRLIEEYQKDPVVIDATAKAQKRELAFTLLEDNPVFDFIDDINPLTFESCEYIGAHSNFEEHKNCKFYMNENTYFCLKSLRQQYQTENEQSEGTTIFDALNLNEEYKKFTILDIFINTIYLIILGYLVSALILFCFRTLESARKEALQRIKEKRERIEIQEKLLSSKNERLKQKSKQLPKKK